MLMSCFCRLLGIIPDLLHLCFFLGIFLVPPHTLINKTVERCCDLDDLINLCAVNTCHSLIPYSALLFFWCFHLDCHAYFTHIYDEVSIAETIYHVLLQGATPFVFPCFCMI